MSSGTVEIDQHLIELKAKVGELTAVRDKIIQLGATPIGTFHQVDTYYRVPDGRLKVRSTNSLMGLELIFYKRENIAEPKTSSVFVLTIPHPHSQVFKRILETLLEIKAVIEKNREIYVHNGIQIHLDNVRDLGAFIEFELVTSDDSKQQEKDKSRLNELKKQLNIHSQQLERFSYSDLI